MKFNQELAEIGARIVERREKMKMTATQLAIQAEMNYLMQFKDPLKIVTDAWLVENEDSIDFDEQLSWMVWELTDRHDADGFYEKEN